MPARSATWLAVAVTALLYAPTIATTPSCVIRRSALVAPVCGLAWWSANTNLILAPFRFGRPLPAANGNSVMPGAPLLMMSTASSSALRSSAPTAAPGPVSG